MILAPPPPAETAPAPVTVPKLEATDTCDRCGPGTQAMVLLTHPELGEFRLCAHHARKHEAAMGEQGFTVAERAQVPA